MFLLREIAARVDALLFTDAQLVDLAAGKMQADGCEFGNEPVVAARRVGLGFLLSTSPVWMATAVSVLGAILMELIRWYGRTRGDIALAMLFYGGMAGGVMFINLAPGGSNANLTSYLFDSLSTVSSSDVVAICLLAAFVVLVTLGLRRQMFAVSQDELGHEVADRCVQGHVAGVDQLHDREGGEGLGGRPDHEGCRRGCLGIARGPHAC